MYPHIVQMTDVAMFPSDDAHNTNNQQYSTGIIPGDQAELGVPMQRKGGCFSDIHLCRFSPACELYHLLWLLRHDQAGGVPPDTACLILHTGDCSYFQTFRRPTLKYELI